MLVNKHSCSLFIHVTSQSINVIKLRLINAVEVLFMFTNVVNEPYCKVLLKYE